MQLTVVTRTLWAIMACRLFFLSEIVYSESRVIRCTSASGQVSFSQTGCESGTRESLLIKNPDVGWIDLKAVVTKFKKKSDEDGSNKRKRKRRTSSPKSGTKAERRRCWSARKQVARIDRELRHGYKLARGEELRYQRMEQEEYLAMFCKEFTP